MMMRFGPYELKPKDGVLLRDGVPVSLGRRAVDVLGVLVESGGAVVTKGELLDRAWRGLAVEESNLTVQVATLRKALGAGEGDDWIVTIPGVGYRFVPPDDGGSPPMIAVLPVRSLSPEPERDYLAASIGEEITMALSRFRGFAVIAQSASAGIAGSQGGMYERAKSSGITYLVESDLRIDGTRLRLTPRLVDAGSGRQLWAESFEGETDELLDFTDTLTARIVGFVEPEIRKAEIERARRRPPKSATAYDQYLKSLPYFRSTDPEGRARAIALLEDAVRLDPEFATASAHAAWAYERQDTFGGGMTEAERSRALALVEAALKSGYDDPLVVAISALVLLNVGGEQQRSLLMMDQALETNPFHATVLSLHAFTNTMVGDLELGRTSFMRALQIAPGAIDNYEILAGIGLVHLFKGEYEDAANWSLRSMALNPDWLGPYWTVIASYGQLGRAEDARGIVAALLARVPGFRVADIERIARRYAARFAVIIEGARSAGLPD